MSETGMRAVVVREPWKKGEWNELEIREVPRPELRPGDVLVRVEACSVNRADLLQRRGLYPPPPGVTSILGLDFAGVIEEVPSDVSGWSTGDRVFGIVAGGGYGRYLAVCAAHLLRIPERLSFAEAAAAAEVYLTAYFNLVLEAGLAPGETLLLHGGGSGVGTAAMQIARAKGARVIVTAGSDERVERCLAMGADYAVNYKETDFAERVREITGGSGVDVILDWIGAPYLERHIDLLRKRGRLVIIGLMGGHRAELSLAPVLMKRLRIAGTTLRSQSDAEKAAIVEAFAKDALPLLASGEYRPVIDRVYAAEEAESAHLAMREGKHFGKIVLTWGE